MAQPSLNKGKLDVGDTPEKIIVVDELDRLPDSDAEFVYNLPAGEINGALSDPSVTVPGPNINGYLINCTIPGANVNGHLTNVLQADKVSGTITQANLPGADVNAGNLDNATIPGANVTGTVSSATDSYNARWSGITGTPSTLTSYNIQVGTDIDDAIDMEYLYDHNYLNYEPKVGKGVNEYVPVSSKFKYSWFEDAGVHIINEYDQEVTYFIASDGKSRPELFRAYKYFSESEWRYVPEPIRPPFLSSTEYITAVYSGSEEYLYVYIYNSSGGTNTAALIYLYNNDDYTVWTRYNLPVSPTRYAQILIDDNRILDYPNNGNIVNLVVYNLSTGAQLGSTITLTDMSTDITYTHPSFTNYNVYSRSHRYHSAFYNKKYNNIILLTSVIGYYENLTTGEKTYRIPSFVGSWSVPSSVITSGTGTLTPLISTSTWNFWSNSTIFNSSAYFRFSYHNPSDTLFVTQKGFWTYDSYICRHRIVNGAFTSESDMTDMDANYKAVLIPDSSPWSKYITSVMLLNNNICLFFGQSNFYGQQWIIAEYYVQSGEVNIVPGRWRLLGTKPAYALPAVLDEAVDPALYSVVTANGYSDVTVAFDNSNNQRIYACQGGTVYEMTFNFADLTINMIDTGLTFPALPANYSSIKQRGYDPRTGRFICLAEKTGENRYVRMLVNSGGTWYESPFINENIADNNRISINGSLTGNASPVTNSNIFIDTDGSYYCNQTYSALGGRYGSPYNRLVFNGTSFTSHTVGSVNAYPYRANYLMSYGNTAGNGNTPSYIAKNTFTSWIRIYNLSAGTTANSAFFTLNTTRSFYVTGSAGLAAYLGSADIFLNGYWSKLQAQAVDLPANSTTYIYVTRDNNSDRRVLTVSTSQTQLPNTFDTVLIASVTTDSANPISQQVFDVNETSVQWDKVKNRPMNAGDIGTYILASRNTAGDVARGSTVAGSSLLSTSIIYDDTGNVAAAFPTQGGLTGTWRCMGTYTYDDVNGAGTALSYGATIWMRIG